MSKDVKVAARSYQAEMYHDAVDAERALWPVSSAHERAAAKLFKLGASYPCLGCTKFAFARPGVRCFWCRKKITTRDRRERRDLPDNNDGI